MSEEETGFLPMDAPSATRSFDVVLRGYERSQVDRYITWLEGALEQARAAATRERPNYAELGQRVARILELAEEEAAELRTTAVAEAATIRADALTATETVRTEAAGIRREAQEEAERVLAQAREDAQRLREQATSEREAMLTGARSELNALQGQREEIARRLGDLREQLAALVADVGAGAGPVAPPQVTPANPDPGEPTMIIRLNEPAEQQVPVGAEDDATREITE